MVHRRSTTSEWSDIGIAYDADEGAFYVTNWILADSPQRIEKFYAPLCGHDLPCGDEPNTCTVDRTAVGGYSCTCTEGYRLVTSTRGLQTCEFTGGGCHALIERTVRWRNGTHPLESTVETVCKPWERGSTNMVSCNGGG